MSLEYEPSSEPQVSSVNEWGADQTRILLLTDEAIHRVKYDPHNEKATLRHTPSYRGDMWPRSSRFPLETP